MKRNFVIGAFFVLSCFATSLAPFAGEQAIVDRIFAAAMSSSRGAGVAALERIADGRPESVDSGIAVAVGMPPDDTGRSAFRDSTVRAHAMRRLGETGFAEAIAYLSGLKASDFESASTRKIWPASRVALKQAEFLNINNQPQRIEFLENLVQTGPGQVGWWAIDELCSLGSLPSFPLIAHAIRGVNSGPSGEEQVSFAEARLRTVTSDPNRVKALASALKISGNQDDAPLIRWAIQQLTTMNTPEADAELDRYSASIASLPLRSWEKENLYHFPDEIRSLRAEREITRHR